MVIKPPRTEIRLYPGEIGTARLYLNGRYHYNIPRIAYTTDEGEVVLFPHEVYPVSIDELNRDIGDGSLKLPLNTKTARYVPTKEMLIQLKEMYGDLIKLSGDWEKDYANLCGE
jgi:hypothetical protein